MAADQLFCRCLPALEIIGDAEESGSDPAKAARDEWDRRPLPDEAYMRTIHDLYRDGVLTGISIGPYLGGSPYPDVVIQGLTPRGRRAIGQWPGGTDAAALLIQVIAGLEASEGDADRKSRLGNLLAAAKDIGVDLAAKTLGEIYAHTAGLP
jgi:hypothetical protein